MLTDPQAKLLAGYVAEQVHKQKLFDAASAIVEFYGIKIKIEDDPKRYLPPLQSYLHTLLDHDAPEEAAAILWTPNQFTSNPQSVKDLWNLFDTSSMGLIMGAASMGKSYSIGVRLMLEWIRDPEWTTIKVLGPSEDHLEANLFSHLVKLHKTASLPMPGLVGELFIGLNRREQDASIKGVVIPIGKVKKAGRLQGAKRKPRINKHPIFGDLSRMFIFIDEIENVPGGLWSDIDNILSNIQGEGSEAGFKLFGAYNPTNQNDEVGKRAEPPFGWENINPDLHYKWKSIRGWDVLRLDGEQSENVKAGKIVYPGLQHRLGLEAIARNAGGTTSAGYASMGRGLYPPQGLEITIIPQGMLPKWRGEFIFYGEPVPVAGCDLALEGGAKAIYTLGKWGKASGIKFPPSLEYPNGHKLMFKDRNGSSIIRWGLQAVQQFALAKGETVAMKNLIIETNRKAGVRPEFFACDRTGAGSGTADLIRFEWSTQIHDVNYSEAASRDKIMIEDSKTCNEQFERLNSELWFALKSWGEFQYFLIHPNIDMSSLAQQLTTRRFRTAGRYCRIESKKDYKMRGFTSPDEADSMTLLVHAARKGASVVLSMKLDESYSDTPNSDDEWYDGMYNYPGGVRIDPSSRTDYLDDRSLQEQPIL